MEKLETAALSPDGSLAMAWQRIAALEQQNAQQKQELDNLHAYAHANVQQQLDDLRRLLTTHESPAPKPVKPRNWREFQNVMEESDVTR